MSSGKEDETLRRRSGLEQCRSKQSEGQSDYAGSSDTELWVEAAAYPSTNVFFSMEIMLNQRPGMPLAIRSVLLGVSYSNSAGHYAARGLKIKDNAPGLRLSVADGLVAPKLLSRRLHHFHSVWTW